MGYSTFLFCDPVSAERAGWFFEILQEAASTVSGESQVNTTVFLTGDALFSLVDSRSRSSWNRIGDLPSVRIIADGDELRLQGLLHSVSSQARFVHITGGGEHGPFWECVVSTLKTHRPGMKRAAFLLCNSPYMSRVPVYMLRFFSRVQEAGLVPEMYTYLDGVHTLHNGQRPSEFENIGRGVSALANSGALSGRDTWFAACSRCATARGYYQMNPGTGFCEPSSCIQEIAIRPLKEILARFFQDHPIVSHFSGECVLEERAKDAPHLVVFITSPPYCSEWTFGGLSLAVAAAMDGMRTTVVFIEDGVFALHGTHDVPENDKIFNIQEMIAVTTDVECLRYAVHSPSLDERGIAVSDDFSPVRMITNADLAGILFGKESGEDAPVVRMIFF